MKQVRYFILAAATCSIAWAFRPNAWNPKQFVGTWQVQNIEAKTYDTLANTLKEAAYQAYQQGIAELPDKMRFEFKGDKKDDRKYRICIGQDCEEGTWEYKNEDSTLTTSAKGGSRETLKVLSLDERQMRFRMRKEQAYIFTLQKIND
ncbi:lipocalin family protein [Eisenibacter elegans]|jgi:hypothetical protein|uniref:lipocalin family protein n=1 Tax=Eisenibacter elegans TaxID=997 RepID=UPI000416F541|nr:lipocalin family protein [Eisenibacter elegans]